MKRSTDPHYIYFDESIHEQEGFIISAFAYFKNDIGTSIAQILSQHSLSEYKSSGTMAQNPSMQEARQKIAGLVRNKGKFGLIVVPSRERANLGEYCLSYFHAFLTSQNIVHPLNIYFDQSMFKSKAHAETISKEYHFKDNVGLFFEQDSREIKGIQTADYIAHNCGTRLKHALLGCDKMVSHFDSDDIEIEISLSFELFATIRYAMFHDGKPLGEEPPELMSCNTTGFFISTNCSKDVVNNATSLFSTVYLGCIN